MLLRDADVGLIGAYRQIRTDELGGASELIH
jgi:hypothetical protein